jgi:hypothetical protein
MIKLHRSLMFTVEHPSAIREIGLAWTTDGESFIANSKLLGRFLKIKAHSINTKIRGRDFVSPENVRSERLAALVPSLGPEAVPDSEHWKRRKHRTGALTWRTTERQAGELDAASRPSPAAPDVRVVSVAYATPGAFLDAARREWTRLLGAVPRARTEQVLEAVFSGEGATVEQMRRNLFHLLAPETEIEALIAGETPFDAFKAVFLRHGSPAGLGAQVEALTPVQPAADDAGACFYPGICFGADRRRLAARWADASVDAWALVDGPQPGAIALLTRGRVADAESDRCFRIAVDPTADARLAVDVAPGMVLRARSVPELLGGLGLAMEAGLVLADPPKVPAPPREPDFSQLPGACSWNSDSFFDLQ